MKLRLLAATAAAVATTALPAHAASVTVHLALSAGTYAPTGAACTLSVPAGADGVAVLDAAVAAHCIVSYVAVPSSFGTYVACIDEVCGTAVTSGTGGYWNMYENGVSTGYGVDGFAAANGDELGFAYQAYCFDAFCPPV